MKLSIPSAVVLALPLLCLVLPSHANVHAAKAGKRRLSDPKSDDGNVGGATIVNEFNQLASDVHQLRGTLDTALANEGVGLTVDQIEPSLTQLSQDVDRLTIQTKEYKQTHNVNLPAEETLAIITSLYDTVTDVREIATVFAHLKTLWDSFHLTGIIVLVFKGLAPGFEQLAFSTIDIVSERETNLVGASILDTICALDKSAVILLPGSRLTGDEYCNTYGTADLTTADYSSVAKEEPKQMPTLPKTPKEYQDCSSLEYVISSMLKFGFDNECFEGKDPCADKAWCSGEHGDEFSPAVEGWTPDHWKD